MEKRERETADGLKTAPWFVGVPVVAVVYFAAARLGLLLASVHGNVSPVWPATGLALGALLLGGMRLWPGVAVGAFAANFLTTVSPAAALFIATGNTLEAVAGAWLFVRCVTFLRKHDIEYLAEPAGFVLAAAVAPVISASGGVLTLLGLSDTPRAIGGTLWLTWWIGDALGALTITPLMLALRGNLDLREWSQRTVARAAVVSVTALGVSWVVFFQPQGGSLLFLIFPVLLLAVAWFGSAGVKLTAFLLSAVGIAAAFFGSGPFTGGSLNEDLLHLQLFLTSVAAAALILPAFPATGRLLPPSILLLVAWALSGWLFYSLHQDRLKADRAQFDARVNDATLRIRQRFATYEDSLRGGAGLFVAAPTAGRNEWRAYAEALRLPERYPGIRGLGVIFPVKPEEAVLFLAHRHAEDMRDFTIKPVPGTAASSPGEEQYVVTYIEPIETNQSALGVDIGSEPSRRAAAEEARDSGEPRITPRISLVQDEQKRPGFLLLVPLYRPGLPLATVAQRRAAFAGWVDASFLTEDFMRGVPGMDSGDIALRLFEGTSTETANQLFASPGSPANAADFERVTQLPLGGRMFTAGWSRGPAFVSSEPSASVWAATSSTLVSLLMVGLVVGVQSLSRRAQALVAERTEALALTEERLGLLIENVQDYAIFALDPHGRVASWNSGAERSSGYTADEIIGRNFSVFFPREDAVLRKHTRLLTAATENGRSEDEGWRVRKDGSRFWASVTITALRNREGKLIGFTKISRDITERKRLEENLAEARDQALQASRLKSEFLATMSHEIRTPMNGIIGMSGLLMESGLSGDQKHMARVLQGSAESLLAIIDDILDFSKIEAGKLRLVTGDFDLRELVDDTLALMAPRAHEKHLELLCDFDASLDGPVVGDAGRIRQVLMNLLSNAIKFTSEGEVMVRVGGKRGASSSSVRVVVSDTGIGVPDEARGRLFQPFMQAESTASRRFGGTGLGLAICRQLIELMGGKIGFESAPGHGASFWFELELPNGAPVSAIDAITTFPAGLRVLVVDDNATNRWIVLEQLSHFGVQAKAVADGSAALAWLWAQAAVNEPCHLVLLDWHMPGMSGLELAAEIRNDPALRKVPLVMLSSAGPLDENASPITKEFAAYLVKPVREVHLRRCLARVLRDAGILTVIEPAAAPPAPAVGLHLLLVEDNPENQLVVRMILEKMGHTVDIAHNGLEALARLPQTSFDAVLMDCQMPVLDGYEATRRIRSGKEPGINPAVPIIALTAHALPEDRQKCLAAGMDDYLTKPVRLSAVREVLLRCGLNKNADKTNS